MDVNEFKDQLETEKLKNGLVLLIDTNKERMLTENYANTSNQNYTDVFDIMKIKYNSLDFMIHLNTIGRTNSISLISGA